MQNVSSSYLKEIKKSSRRFESRITIGNDIYTNSDLINMVVDDVQPNDGFSIGTTISKSLELTLHTTNAIYANSVIKVEVGLYIESNIEYVLIGYFNIDDIEKNGNNIKLTCYDNMMKFEKPYFSNLGKSASLKDIVNELSKITGVEFTGSLPSYNLNKLEGFTCREILGFIASLCAGNAYITRDGKFTIKTLSNVNYSITDENYISLKTEEYLYKIGAITCKSNESELTKGALSNSSMEVVFENPWVTDAILTDIYNTLNGFEYIGYSMKWQGDLSLDVCDIISITDKNGVSRNVPILSQKINYNGGLISEIGAKGESKNKNEFNQSGNLGNKVNRVVTNLLIVNEALINKADIGDLKALNAIIGNLEVSVGKIETLINGNLTSINIQSMNITSDKFTVENGFIKNAMIENLDISKINAGDLLTSKFRIISDDGGIEIVGNTQQFKDKNNKVRVQIGKDAKGNFNFIIRGEDGKTTLIDQNGIKSNAIADDLIVGDMIASDAVGEKQINYNSFITGFNKDANVSTIKATKIMLNNQNQTLDIAFNNLKTQSDETKSLTESNSTTIGVMQGKINTAINNTQIIKDGKTILLKDDYNTTVQTIDSMKSTIGSHTSQLDGFNSLVNSQNSTIEQLKNQITLKVSANDVSSIIQQNPTSVKIGFNGINDIISINERSMDFTAANGNRDMLLYGGQVCIYNNTNNTFMSTMGSVLKTADMSYKGVGFLLGKNANIFTIGRDVTWDDILSNRSPNPLHYITFNFDTNQADIDMELNTNHINMRNHTLRNASAIGTQKLQTNYWYDLADNPVFTLNKVWGHIDMYKDLEANYHAILNARLVNPQVSYTIVSGHNVDVNNDTNILIANEDVSIIDEQGNVSYDLNEMIKLLYKKINSLENEIESLKKRCINE